MALIKCDDCGHDISDKSLFCPHCGRPTHLNSGYPRQGEVPPAYTAMKKAMDETAAADEDSASPIEPETTEESLARTQRRNERAKVLVFVGVFMLLLATVVYFYFTTPATGAGDNETISEDTAAVITETAPSAAATADSTDLAATDSTAQTATPRPAVTTSRPAAKNTSPATRKPAASNDARPDDSHELTVKSLREQVSPPEQTPAPPAE